MGSWPRGVFRPGRRGPARRLPDLNWTYAIGELSTWIMHLRKLNATAHVTRELQVQRGRLRRWGMAPHSEFPTLVSRAVASMPALRLGQKRYVRRIPGAGDVRRLLARTIKIDAAALRELMKERGTGRLGGLAYLAEERPEAFAGEPASANSP